MYLTKDSFTNHILLGNFQDITCPQIALVKVNKKRVEKSVEALLEFLPNFQAGGWDLNWSLFQVREICRILIFAAAPLLSSFLSFLIQSFFVFSWQFFNKKNFQVGEIFGTLIFAPLLSSSRVQYLMEPLLYIHTVDSTHTHILSFQDDHDHEGVDNDQDPQKTAD